MDPSKRRTWPRHRVRSVAGFETMLCQSFHAIPLIIHLFTHTLSSIIIVIDVHDDLCQRFPNLVLPGILLNNDVWVHGDNGRELQAAWGKAWFDHVLNTPDEEEDDEDDQEEELDIYPAPFPSPLLVKGTPSKHLGETVHSANSQSTSLYTTPSTTSSHLANIVLPNGTSVDMGALIRLLMRGT